MCKISVIVPVYNVENYLKESLNSLLKQTFKDFEIICINDGSTDNSQEILEQFSKIDKRVKLINKTNEGCGSARNKGLSLANGEYVYFFDPDDYIREDTLERLYTNAKNNDSDMVISQIAWVREGEPVNYNIPGFDFENIFTDVDYEDFTFNYEDIKEYVLNSYYAPWTKLYKRDFISKNNFKFHEKLAYDDVPFHVETIIKAEKISFIPEAFYHYRISNPTSVNKIPSNTVDIFRIWRKSNIKK